MGGLGWGGGFRVDVNREEKSFCQNSKKKLRGGGGGGRGRVGVGGGGGVARFRVGG